MNEKTRSSDQPSDDKGEEQSKRPDRPLLPPLQAGLGITAVAGEVRTLDEQPLEGVTLRIGGHIARTDETGRFLLISIPSGHHKLLIDGRTASRGGRTYGVFEVGVDVKASRTNILPFTIWMPELDMANTVFIPSPTQGEVVVTNPNIPGLELHLPPGTVIRDRDGRVVTHLNITPIPVDRPPFPLPFDTEFPMYFTVQPGGCYVEPYGARLIYPNTMDDSPGTPINFWHYDTEKGWQIYGRGTVSADGKQVVPTEGIAVYQFSGASVGPFSGGPSPGGEGGPDPNDGDPVDLGTGLFVFKKTDLFLPDVLPIALTRTQRPANALQGIKPFGVGSGHIYEIGLFFDDEFQEADLVLSEGGRVHYSRISPGTGSANAIFEHTATPSMFFGSRVRNVKKHWELTLKNGTVYEFSDSSVPLLLSLRNRYGSRITILRDGGEHGKAIQAISPNGRWLSFTLDQFNRIAEAKDNIGRVVTYTYAEQTQRNELRKVTDAAGDVTEYTYDSSNGIETIKDGRGIVFLTCEYGDKRRVIKQTQIDGGIYKFAYTEDDDGKIIQTDVTDPRGNVRRVTFNPAGYILTDTRGLGTPEEQTTIYERQAGTNLVLAVTDPLGRKTAYTYDAMGNVKSVTRLAETPDAITTIFTYESKFNQLDSVTDPLGHSTRFGYDHKGSLTSITDPLGNSTILDYDPEGLPISITDPLGNVTRLTYDLGILSTITDPLGFTTKRYIDSAGRPIILTDPRGQVTKYAYDDHNRLTQVTDPLGGVTAFAYDPNGNLDRVTDARGSVTIYTYDDMDRLESRTDPLKRSESYEYDKVGNLTKLTDRKQQVTTFTYDALNRLTTVAYADASTTTYGYDAGDRLREVVDSISGTVTLDYDDFDQLTEVSSPQGTISYTYDAAGRCRSMEVQGQPTVTYNYDDANRLTEIAQGTTVVSVTRDDAGRPKSLTLPADVVVEYGYDAASRLMSIRYTRAGSVLGDLTYDYDSAGNCIQTGGSFARITVPEPVASLIYDEANRLTQTETTPHTHDENGNLTSDGVRTYTWDARNRLTLISGPGIEASFGYDALGRRVRKIINGTTTEFLYDGLNVVQELSGGAPVANLLTGLGIDEYFIRTDANSIQILLFDALGSTLGLLDADGLLQTEYTYEPFGATTATGTASTNPFQYTGRENDATGLYYYRARYYNPTLRRFISEDPLGLNYESFGSLVSDNNPAFDPPVRFARGRARLFRRFVRPRFKDYVPTAGRWTIRSPILCTGTQANLYTYAANNPINFRDPSGLKPDDNPFETAHDIVGGIQDILDWSNRAYTMFRGRELPIPEPLGMILGPLEFGLQIGALQNDLFRRIGDSLP